MKTAPGMRVLLGWILGFLLIGLISALLWVWLANPAKYTVTAHGATMDEQASKARFGVIVTFVLISAVAALIGGLLGGVLLRDRGWVVVPIVALVSVAAGLIAWKVGVLLGPPNPSTVKGAKPGDLIPERLTIDAVSPFLVWPIFALLGVFLVTLAERERVGHRSATTADVYAP